MRGRASTGFSPSTMWDPGIELRFSGLEAGSLPLWQVIALLLDSRKRWTAILSEALSISS